MTEWPALLLLPLHLGKLHAYEQALVMLIAFGPFLVLGVVVWVVRRRDLAADEAEQAATRPSTESARNTQD